MLHELELAIFDSRFGSLVAAPSSVLSDVIAVDRPLTYGILMPGPDQSDGVPYVRVTDMEGGRIKVASVRRTTPAIDAKFARSKLEAGDLLMSIRGHVGRTATVPRELEGANITQDTARIAVRGAAQGYVKAWLGTPSAQEWMRKHTKGVAVQGINLSDVRRIPISLPSIDEQLEFVSEVDLLGRQRERAREHLLQLDELFASLQHRAFAGEL
jgi:type I restriction enzyme S subunit